MKYFLDTEFHEQGPAHPIELISVAVVAEDGRQIHVVNTSFDWDTASEWLKENVRPYLHSPFGDTVFAEMPRIATLITKFLGNDPEPEFWGYYSDYDWVVFCQLFGSMTHLPATFPYYCRDLRQWLDERGLQHVKQPDDAVHNAISDAQWVKETYFAQGGD